MKKECDGGWTESEFKGLDLGDKRRNARLKLIAEKKGAQPNATINQAHQSWSDTKSAYELFRNESVTPEKILKPHIESTKSRALKEEVVLAIQDTTVISYQGHAKTKDLAIVNKTGKGLLMHSTLMVTEDGVPLGLGSQKLYTRENKEEKDNAHQSKPIIEKESFRWIEALDVISKRFGNSSSKIIMLGDRENDIYEFIQLSAEKEVGYVIRGSYDRILEDGGKIKESVLSEPSLGSISIDIPARSGEKAEVLQLEVYCKTITLSAARRRGGSKWIKLVPQTVTAILAKEAVVEEGEEPKEWMLLTNIQVDNLSDALKYIQYYQRRWQIEMFHKTLKSGCAVEKCRLETVERLYNYLTLTSIVAWRILWCTHIARSDPKAPATDAFTKAEIEVLQIRESHKQNKVIKIKNVQQAIKAIAKLGGFLARRWDGNPGITYVWRGFQVLDNSLDMFFAMNKSDNLQTFG